MRTVESLVDPRALDGVPRASPGKASTAPCRGDPGSQPQTDVYSSSSELINLGLLSTAWDRGDAPGRKSSPVTVARSCSTSDD